MIIRGLISDEKGWSDIIWTTKWIWTCSTFNSFGGKRWSFSIPHIVDGSSWWVIFGWSTGVGEGWFWLKESSLPDGGESGTAVSSETLFWTSTTCRTIRLGASDLRERGFFCRVLDWKWKKRNTSIYHSNEKQYLHRMNPAKLEVDYYWYHWSLFSRWYHPVQRFRMTMMYCKKSVEDWHQLLPLTPQLCLDVDELVVYPHPSWMFDALLVFHLCQHFLHVFFGVFDEIVYEEKDRIEEMTQGTFPTMLNH